MRSGTKRRRRGASSARGKRRRTPRRRRRRRHGGRRTTSEGRGGWEAGCWQGRDSGLRSMDRTPAGCRLLCENLWMRVMAPLRTRLPIPACLLVHRAGRKRKSGTSKRARRRRGPPRSSGVTTEHVLHYAVVLKLAASINLSWRYTQRESPTLRRKSRVRGRLQFYRSGSAGSWRLLSSGVSAPYQYDLPAYLRTHSGTACSS